MDDVITANCQSSYSRVSGYNNLTWDAGDAEEVGGADVEGFQYVRRVVGVNHRHFTE